MGAVRRKFEIECLDGERLNIVEKLVTAPPSSGEFVTKSSIEFFTEEGEPVRYDEDTGFYEISTDSIGKTVGVEVSIQRMRLLIEAKRHWCEVIDLSRRDVRWAPGDIYRSKVLINGHSHRFLNDPIPGGHRCKIFAGSDEPAIKFNLVEPGDLENLTFQIDQELRKFFQSH